VRLSPSVAILRTQSDERLVELARDGSEAAFAAIVERYRRAMLRGCRRVLPESRAEDAVQQSFISAWRALERGDAVADLHAWLMRIARNTALNALRVSGYDYDELRDSLRGSEAPQSELERRDVVRQTLAGLAALPERQRDALMRSALEGASHAEIAQALGLSEGATRQLVMRARATMRSTATAVTPGPLIAWVASSGRDGSGEIVQRIAELTAGGGAGAGALLAKAGVVTVVVGSVVVGPSIVRQEPERAKADSAPSVASAKRGSNERATFAGLVSATTADGSGRGQGASSAATQTAGSHSGKGSGGDGSSGSGSGSGASGSGSSGSGSGSATSGGSDDSATGSTSSGSGSSGSDDGASSGSGSGSSGSGTSGSDDGVSSASGSGSSGSGSSGSGSSDDGVSGSGSSGSGTSGGGSSGSGSDDLTSTVPAEPTLEGQLSADPPPAPVSPTPPLDD
jgi:RNA polymerase sigma factor (sigma-70 family)